MCVNDWAVWTVARRGGTNESLFSAVLGGSGWMVTMDKNIHKFKDMKLLNSENE